MSDEEITTTEEETKPPVETEAPPTETVTEAPKETTEVPPTEEIPGGERLRRERDEATQRARDYEIRMTRLEGELEALRRQPSTTTSQQPLTPEQRRAMYEQDGLGYLESRLAEMHNSLRQQTVAARKELEDDRAEEIYSSAPERNHPDFKDRMAAIIDEVWPGDREDRLLPSHMKAARALKLYRQMYAEKSAGTIPRQAPPASKGAVIPKADARPTAEDMEEAKARFNEGAKDHPSGKGWGHRKVLEWRAKKLM